VLDYRNDDYNALKRQIDEVIKRTPSAAEYEAAKGPVLARFGPYVDFLARATGTSAGDVRHTLLELSSDRELFGLLDAGLQALAGYAKSGVRTGEIRIHAPTIYTVVRLLKPRVMVETGVASGKSSALILRALERNNSGQLYSVDLPTYEERAAPGDDGLLPMGRTPGWLVPEALKGRWTLRLGDARALLPALQDEIGAIDIFFHDSLHTYEHMTFELSLAASWVRPGGTVMCDDVQDNEAFEEASRGCAPAVFGTFGVYRPRGGRA
jgi:predicted O-methyltransferase YrrM